MIVDVAGRLRRQCDMAREANARARNTRVCPQCGEAFLPAKRSSKQVAAGYQQTHCSRECLSSSLRGQAVSLSKARFELLRVLVSRKECRCCGSVFVARSDSHVMCSDQCRAEDARLVARRRNEERNQRDRTPRLCRECGLSFSPEYGNKRRDFCSQDCGDAFRARVDRAKRRPRKAGVLVTSVDPLVVLNRDGWRCYLCGEETPEELRGTWHPRAPEVDHVVPLIDGGEHSYANTACACRECNHAKSLREGADREWFRRPNLAA